MGLLDFKLPDINSPEGQGLLAASLSLMQAQQMPGQKGAFSAALGQAGQQFMGVRNQAASQGAEREMQRLKLDALKRQAEQDQQMRDAARSAYRSPEQANAMSMGPTEDGGSLPTVRPGFDAAQYSQALYGIDPMKGLAFDQATAKDDAPVKLAPGESLYSGRASGYKPLLSVPAKEAAAPAAVQEYQFAKQQGYPGSFVDFQLAQKRAGASSTRVNVNTEKSLLNEIAGGLGKQITTAKEGATAALGTINTVNRLMSALDSGKVMAGPATTFRQSALQLGSLLGVSGKDAQEKMLNTRQAIQSLAQLELDAAQQMKGQGQITEAERYIIRRAASGDIDGMTTGELRLLGGVLDRTARFKIRSYNTQAAPLKAMPNAAPLVPFIDVAEPEQRGSAQGVRRYNPATGRIE